MSYVFVRHQVRDFKKWKPIYDSHLPARQKAGLTEKQLFRDADDPNKVTLLFEASDDAKAKAFASSTDLKQTMERAGVLGKPDIFFLKSAK